MFKNLDDTSYLDFLKLNNYDRNPTFINYNVGNYNQYENFIDKFGFNYSKKKKIDISSINNASIDTSFYNFYDNFSAVEYLVQIVDSNIVPGSSIIVPPYFEMMGFI